MLSGAKTTESPVLMPSALNCAAQELRKHAPAKVAKVARSRRISHNPVSALDEHIAGEAVSPEDVGVDVVDDDEQTGMLDEAGDGDDKEDEGEEAADEEGCCCLVM